jgi:hypothetical protein
VRLPRWMVLKKRMLEIVDNRETVEVLDEAAYTA